MTSRISHTSFDAINAHAQSVFWSQVLDFVEDPDGPDKPGHGECMPDHLARPEPAPAVHHDPRW
jgi:hypothetical protein